MKKVIGCFMYVLLGIYILINFLLLKTLYNMPEEGLFANSLASCFLFNGVLFVAIYEFRKRRQEKKKNKQQKDD